MSYENIQGLRALGTIAMMGGTMSRPEPNVWSIIDMIQYNYEALVEPGSYIYYPKPPRASLHDIARNAIVRDMRGDWLLMIDSDMQFDPDAAARMLRIMHSYDLDVVSGVYPYKDHPTVPVLSAYDEEHDHGQNIIDWNRDCEIFQFYGGGAGCLLVRKRVFDRMLAELHEQPFSRRGERGEDFSFFARCRELKIECWCAWRVKFGHLDYQAKVLEEQNLNRLRFPHVVRETVGIGQIDNRRK